MFKLLVLAVTSATATLRNGDMCSSDNDCMTSCCAVNEVAEDRFVASAPEASFDATTGRFYIDYENMVCQSQSDRCSESPMRSLEEDEFGLSEED
jgi:hypothetical protein